MAENAYRPYKHLVSWQATDRRGNAYTAIHLPYQYRLLELSQRFPTANFETEVIHVNDEKDIILLKVSLFVGMNYETSARKTQSTKQGKLSQADKVERAAQNSCMAAWGIGTTSALESKPTPRKDRLNSLYARAKALNLMESPSGESFLALIRETLDIQSLEEKDLTHDKLDTIEAFLDGMEY